MTSPDTLADLPYLYLTTTGRKTGLPREIEIWFVQRVDRFYIFAEHGHNAQWVKNIQHNPQVLVRVGETTWRATARVLERVTDDKLWQAVQAQARHKYGWGEGLPVEITPVSLA